jgi:hypothetical protein
MCTSLEEASAWSMADWQFLSPVMTVAESPVVLTCLHNVLDTPIRRVSRSNLGA